jgi:hypothetical protein
VTADETGAKRRLDRLAEELSDRGLAEQTDFYLTGRLPMDVPSSEHIGISYRDGLYRSGKRTWIAACPDGDPGVRRRW